VEVVVLLHVLPDRVPGDFSGGELLETVHDEGPLPLADACGVGDDLGVQPVHQVAEIADRGGRDWRRLGGSEGDARAMKARYLLWRRRSSPPRFSRNKRQSPCSVHWLRMPFSLHCLPRARPAPQATHLPSRSRGFRGSVSHRRTSVLIAVRRHRQRKEHSVPNSSRESDSHRRRTHHPKAQLGRPPAPSSARATKVMKGNRSRGTSPERLLLSCLKSLGAPMFKSHEDQLPGTPDIVFTREKTAVFVNGCFWHRCPRCRLPTPKTHGAYWRQKIEINARRDQGIRRELTKRGWKVIVVWECEVRRDTIAVGTRILRRFMPSGSLSPQSCRHPS